MTDVAPVWRNPYDLHWKALRVLELAVREASSVDEHDTGKLSYIGAWGMVVDAMLGHIPYVDRDRALAWTQAHNDEAAGQSHWLAGSPRRACDDARGTAVDILKTLNSEAFAQTLEGVTKQGNARLTFWDHVVTALKAKERSGEGYP